MILNVSDVQMLFQAVIGKKLKKYTDNQLGLSPSSLVARYLPNVDINYHITI